MKLHRSKLFFQTLEATALRLAAFFQTLEKMKEKVPMFGTDCVGFQRFASQGLRFFQYLEEKFRTLETPLRRFVGDLQNSPERQTPV